MVALAPVPVIPAYSISKAATLNITQALRALLVGKGVSVHAELFGRLVPDVTGVSRYWAPTDVAARGNLRWASRGEEDIFPDLMSRSVAELGGWGAAKALERRFAAFLPQSAAASLTGSRTQCFHYGGDT